MTDAPSPGLYRDVPEAIYRAWPCVSQSHLHELVARSPLHAHYAATHPSEPTGAMRFGSQAHMICLEPGRLEREYQCAPQGLDRRTNAGKATWSAILADGREPLDFDDYAALQGLRDALYAHPTAGALFTAKGLNELSLVWDDYAPGANADLPALRMKARPDRLTTWEDWPTIVDLKTIDDASPRWLPYRIGDYRWFIQAAAYRRAAAAIDVLQRRSPVERRFLWVFVEKEPPHAISLHELDAASLAEAEEQLCLAIELWAKCQATGNWPGYPVAVQGVSLPEKFWRRTT